MKINKLYLKNYNSEPVSFVETSMIKEGVACDVYNFTENSSKDLGIVKLQKGCKTPLQKVQAGDKTLETFISGKGTLTVTSVDGEAVKYTFPAYFLEVEVKVGELMQWEALEDLIFAELCYPPYQEGRFETVNEVEKKHEHHKSDLF